VPAYTYEKTLDLTKPERGLGVNARGGPKLMKYQNGKVVREVAVLMGDFDTVDDSTAQKLLKKLKDWQPESLRSEQPQTGQQGGTLQKLEKSLVPASAGRSDKGPLAHAMMATNPLLPREYFASRGVDKVVLDLNKDARNSLLDCPGRYTICVATFTGTVLIDQKKIAEVERGKAVPDRLVEGEEKAHKLTEWLRSNRYGSQVWDAYEFHDRDKSIVCVGSFNSLGSMRPDGTLELDPRVQEILNTFGNDQALTLAGGEKHGKAIDVAYPAGTPARLRKKPELILFDLVPKPMEIPRRSISADYQRSMRSDL